MITPLFALGFKRKNLPLWLLASLVLGALSVFAYTVAPLNGIRFLRGELPELFLVLGYLGDSSLPFFVLSSLYGFLLPLLCLLYGAREAGRLLARPLGDGRVSQLLAAGRRRSAILFTLFLNALLGGALLVLAALLGQLVMVPLFFPGADLPALLRLALGFLPVSLINTALAFLLAAVLDPAYSVRRARVALALFLLVWMASRLPALFSLRFLTFWSFFQGQALLSGAGGLTGALTGLLLCLLCGALTLLSFSKREF